MTTHTDYRPIPSALSDAERDAPRGAVVDELRRRFPTEDEYDRMLTRKMVRRNESRGRNYGLEELAQCLQSMLADVVPADYQVLDLRWLTGGASKIQIGFTLKVAEPGEGWVTEKLVLRMEPPESLNATSRVREFEVLNALEGTIPVPAVRWLDEDGRWFPEPALVYSWMPGAPKPSLAQGRIAGIGLSYGPRLRQLLGPQFIELLARIHTFDHTGAALAHYQRPRAGTTESALWQVNRARRVWEEDRGEAMPLLDVAANWLADNAPVLDEVSLVHGDYRGGNFLFDETSGKITAVLDWERSILGDRHRDLAWTMMRPFGHPAEDGRGFLVTGLVPESEFIDRYTAASGLTVDPDALVYYRILNEYQSVVTAIGSAYRVSKLGRSHQDVLLTRLEATGVLMADRLHRDLAEVL